MSLRTSAGIAQAHIDLGRATVDGDPNDCDGACGVGASQGVGDVATPRDLRRPPAGLEAHARGAIDIRAQCSALRTASRYRGRPDAQSALEHGYDDGVEPQGRLGGGHAGHR